MDLSKIRHVQPLDPVTGGVTSQPTKAIELRLKQLEDLVLQLTSSQALSQVIIYNVPAAADVGLHDVVYFDPNSNVYERAQAQVTLKGTSFDFNPSAIALGIVVKTHAGQTVDILVGGYDLVSTYRDAGSNSLHFLEDNETFQPGVPYYLSAKVPGKLTRFAPAFKIQVIVASNAHFVVAPCYSNPDAVENTYPLPLGMRPVGALRPLPPGNDHVQIVGFDALEKVSRNEPNPAGGNFVFNEWRITKFDSLRFDPSNPHAGVPAHLNFGYMVADATVTVQPGAPVYVGLKVAQTTGVITAFFSKSLLGIFDSSNPDCYVHDMVVGPALTSGNFSTSTRTVIVTDQANINLGTISFCFTDPDVSTDRLVVFEFPTSFQGWKMVDAPEIPTATCSSNGTGAVDSGTIVITGRGYGYNVAPSVIFADPPAGAGARTATGHTVLDERGRVVQIVVDDAGAGYTASSPVAITITGRLQSVAVSSGGRGFLTAPALTVSSPDDPVVFEQATVEANMVCNIIESVDRVSAGTGYTSVPGVVQEAGPSAGSGATFTPILTTNSVVDIPVLTSGAGYQDVPAVTITGAHGAPASATAIMKPSPDGNGMAVDYIRIDDGGNGYSGVVTATLTPVTPPTTAATLDVVTIDGAGAIQEIETTSPGAGYSPAQALVAIDVVAGGTGYLAGGTGSFDIIFTGGSTNATGKARVTAGVITRVDLLSRGAGYTAAPAMDLTTNGGGGTGASLSARLLQFPLLGFQGGGSTFATFTVGASDISAGQLIGSDLGDGTRVLYPTTPGSGYDPNFRPAVVIEDNNGTGAQGYVMIDPGTGAVQYLVITQPGAGYDSANPPAIGLAWGKDVAGSPVVGGYIASVSVVNPGKGYSYPPVIQIGSGSDADSGGAVLSTAISGDGGSRSHYRLQVTRFNDEPNMSAVAKPTTCDFYYNAKADPNFNLRWPPVPVDKATFVMNGVEVTTTILNEGAGTLADSDADVGLSNQTLFWTTSHADGCPWDQFWDQYRQLAANADSGALINGTYVTQDNSNVALPADLVAAIQWYWWEGLSLFEGNRNRAMLYINQLGRLPQTGKVSSLQVLSPLKVIDLSTGVSSEETDTPMTGHLQIMLDNQASFLTGASPQVDLAVPGSPQVIYQNNTGKKVYISSFLIESVFQRAEGTAPVLPTNTAKITIGTQRGSYRDIVGMLDPTASVNPGADACLTDQGQFKELLPDADGAPTIVQPGESVYLSVLSPAGGPIVSQIVTVRTRGYAY